jgi:hypothetical protein
MRMLCQAILINGNQMIVGTTVWAKLRVFIHCFFRLHTMTFLTHWTKEGSITEWGCEECLMRRAK